MKTVKMLVCLMLALIILLVPIPRVSASSQTQTPKSGNYIRIRYAGNEKYLDVPAEGINNNGTQLQIWEYAYGNQNQIFHLNDTGNGWCITSLKSGKVIEVRDSSHDDYAQVAQWDKHDLACARWDIVKNDDGTVSFRNRESGLFLNVCGGGDAANGTKIIQYHNDGTVAMRFYIDVMTNADVLSATYDRQIKTNNVQWTQYNPFTSYTYNQTGWQIEKNSKYYYPTVGQKVFSGAEFLSPNTVANLLRDKSYNKSTWNQIESALAGEMSESAVAALLEQLGFGDVPVLGTAIGILQILWDSQDAEQWNRFVDAAKIDAQGRCSGVIVYTYYEIVKNPQYAPLNNGTTAWGWQDYIRKIISIEYKSWTGDNFADVKSLPVSNTSGRWYYHFK